jgi:DNA-binding response OmpR family regulator
VLSILSASTQPRLSRLLQIRAMPDDALTAWEPTLNGTRILLVHRGAEQELTRALAREGHDVLTVADRHRPASLLGVFKPAVVLVVAGEPAGVCRALRRWAPDVAIVAIVPGRDVDERVAAREAGADDCLSTPFDRAGLSARMRAARRRRRLASTDVPVSGTPALGGAL